MEIEATEVGLLGGLRYERQLLKNAVDKLASAIGFSFGSGSRVLIKPNLITAGSPDNLACTHPLLVAAVAEWLLDHGGRVSIGDSPAFGSAKRVMRACGIADAIKGLPVRQINFNCPRKVTLAGGFEVGIEAEILDSDIVVNLPKCKAHSQMRVTLGVKNLFGSVVGLRKPLFHARFGDIGNRFESLLVDLLAVVPGGMTLLDSIHAMQGTGPIKGDPADLGVLAASRNPVALDTAMLSLLGCDMEEVPLWQECRQRELVGTRLENLRYPLQKPETILIDAFVVPATLKPVTFHPARLVVGGIKRMFAHLDTT